MMKTRNIGAMLALGALAALPACSMFGGGSSQSSESSAATPPSTYATAPASYGTPGTQTGTSGTVAPVSPAMIRSVQTTLKQNGDYRGGVDGIWGPMTESGVRTWQQAHNLNANGEIDSATLQSMNIPAGSQASNQPGQTGNSAATQPTGNPNYSTNPNQPTGSSYSNNGGQTAAPTSPAPTSQGTTSTGNNASGGTQPSATSGTASH
jgi:peptidoglycan hydrolase-like protein with peptidoglycan-binding domain